MPVSQNAQNVASAFKVQSGIGVPASGSGATGIRYKPGQGLKLAKAIIPSEETRRDGQTSRGRHGSRTAGAVYADELSLGSFDPLFEALMRSTFVASATITQAAMTSITTTGSTLVAAAGSWLTQGVRRGDMFMLTGHSTAANNGRWIRVVDVSATTITVPTGALTLDPTPDSIFTVTIAKTVVSGAAPTERYFTCEDFFQDIAKGLLGTDLKVSKVDFNAQPNKNIEVVFTLMGLDVQPNISGTPTFTAPTYTTHLPMVMVDGIIRIGGVDYNVLTGFQFSYDLGGSVPPTLSSKSPDVFLDNAKLSGSFTAIRQDLTFFSAFSSETQMDFFILCSENAADPKDFISFYIGNATLNGADAPIGASGPMVETVPWMAGKDELGGAHASTMLKIATSAP